MMGIKKYKSIHLMILSIIFMLSSCLPEAPVQTSRTVDTGVENSSDNTTTTIETKTLPEEVNFFQINSTKELNSISIFANYTDSFLIRGNNIIDHLSTQTNLQTNYCLMFNFPTSSGATSKNIAIVSARVRSFYNPDLLKKEYYLQVEPNNTTINRGDCLTTSLVNKVNSLYSTTSIAFEFSDICPDCKTNISSLAPVIFNTGADEIAQISLNHLFLTLIPRLGASTTPTNNTCSINAECTSLQFNCCLNGQCVNHGEVQAGVSTSSNKYLIAVRQILGNPALITNYPDLFYICPSMVPTTVDNTPTTGNDPGQDATDRFTELEDLYNCTTPIVDEFSICSKEYEDASVQMSSAPVIYDAGLDDITFGNINSNLTYNNITQIDYAGVTFYKEKLLSTDSELALNSGLGSITVSNDSLITAQKATLQIPLPVNPINDTVKIYYKVDGTCKKLGSGLARCKKYYNQAQSSSPPRSSDHASGVQTFKVPSYANTSLNVIVEVGGSRVTTGINTWTLSGNTVSFNPISNKIYDNQEVVITYFVTTNVSALMASKEDAQSKINTHCSCDPAEPACSLSPQYSQVNGENKVTSFLCVYPRPNLPPVPLQKTVYINSKTVPHKFFDQSGVYYDPDKIPANSVQEGTKFEYTDSNHFKPNNTSSYIGFNEIYGSFNQDQVSAMPATVIDIEKGKNYDLFVDSGSYSSCLNCGVSYYNSLQKVFPNNFLYMGAGFLPSMVESSKLENKSLYNADDFKFGRACFVPATMIPWTHNTNSSTAQQRRDRQAAQHFLFANGYNKDWYGFDYGSLIGSFDGVKWFAIGNQRRIEAKSNKLFVALNAYYGDLTITNSYKVTINQMAAVINSGSTIAHDLDSDGAQCQKAHLCESDNDCITQLGYEYSCQNVSALTTPWPIFDSNGNESSGSQTTSLLSLVGGSNGKAKRCVYRGKGSLCEKNPFSVNISDSYTQSTKPDLHQCSPNTYCEDINISSFNTKVARYAHSPLNQNLQSFITEKSDLVGLGARLLGRPYNLYGTEAAPRGIFAQLQAINVHSMCIPGKDSVNSTTIKDANHLKPASNSSDSINNIGNTKGVTTLQSENYFAFCPATDDNGDYTHFQDIALNDDKHKPFALRNNMSTNSLDLSIFSSLGIFNDDSTPVSAVGYQKNKCLRAPGATCFTDFECSPNQFISTKIKRITNFNGVISEAEQDFWKEELVCSNSQTKYLPASNYPNPEYDTTENRCCRETNKTFTYYSQNHEGSDFKIANAAGDALIPGYNQDINSPERYSRTHVTIDKFLEDPVKYPLTIVPTQSATSALAVTSNTIKQYNTLHLNNSRMCCTGSWVRSYASGRNGNGGGHKALPGNAQNISIDTFRSLSWNPNNDPAINAFQNYLPLPYACQPMDYQTADCEVKNIPIGSTDEEKYMNWFGKLELIGIPQVLIETNNHIYAPLDRNQVDISASKEVLPNTIKNVNLPAFTKDADYDGKEYYSATSYDNFEISSSKLKKVFSENEFNCCIPTGVTVPAGTSDQACCTGQIDSSSGSNKCCLNDFTNVSVYTNRYVSSEGATLKGQVINDSDIDPTSGYVKKEVVLEMAKNMCCSGSAVFGNVIDNLLIPISGGGAFPNAKTRRWMYDETLDNATEVNGAASKYNAGLKWNNHIYCVPEGYPGAFTNAASN